MNAFKYGNTDLIDIWKIWLLFLQLWCKHSQLGTSLSSVSHHNQYKCSSYCLIKITPPKVEVDHSKLIKKNNIWALNYYLVYILKLNTKKCEVTNDYPQSHKGEEIQMFGRFQMLLSLLTYLVPLLSFLTRSSPSLKRISRRLCGRGAWLRTVIL